MSEINENLDFCKLFIGGLNHQSTEASLKSHFEKWGEIVHCTVKRDPHTKESKRFGFITYKRAHMVDAAQAARPHIIDGHEVESKRALPRENSDILEATVKTLYVCGIKDDLGEEGLREYFGSYGNIVRVRIINNMNDGKKRDYAFVEFDDYDPVDKIVLKCHNYNGRKLIVNKALSRQQMAELKIKKEMADRKMKREIADLKLKKEIADLKMKKEIAELKMMKEGGGIGQGEGAVGSGVCVTAAEFAPDGCGGGAGYGGGYWDGYGGGYGIGGGGGWDVVLDPAMEVKPCEEAQATPSEVEDLMVFDVALVNMAVDKLYIN